MLHIVSLKRNPPLTWNLSMTGNFLCSKNYIELTLNSIKNTLYLSGNHPLFTLFCPQTDTFSTENTTITLTERTSSKNKKNTNTRCHACHAVTLYTTPTLTPLQLGEPTLPLLLNYFTTYSLLLNSLLLNSLLLNSLLLTFYFSSTSVVVHHHRTRVESPPHSQ